jgi:hypothetical protein
MEEDGSKAILGATGTVGELQPTMSLAATAPARKITGQGNAPKTIEGRNTAVNNFNEFCVSKKYPVMGEMSGVFFCRDELLRASHQSGWQPYLAMS